MRRVSIEGTSLSVSRFTFGTASIHHIGNEGIQADHLRAAADAGFCHFDTAPLYGFGSAERALGGAFGTHIDKVTIATKVGLYPPGGCEQSRLIIVGRKVLGRLVKPLSKAQVDWDINRARTSLTESLARLRRDHVDLLLLHEPQYNMLIADEWLYWLEQESRHRVSNFGIAGISEHLKPFIVTQSELAKVLQIQDSIDKCEADLVFKAGRNAQFTYGYLSSVSARDNVEVSLRSALTRNPVGSVIVATRKRSRLDIFSAIADAEKSC